MITLDVDTREIERRLGEIAVRQVPFAAALALNDTAKDGKDAVELEMKVSFDRPKPFTLNAFRVQRASKNRLQAMLLRKTMVAGRHYLEVQEAGGTRPQTGMERRLASKVKAGGVRSVYPARGARRDKYGNWSRGQRNQVLAAIEGQGGKGAGKFFVPRPGSGLAPGVYQRMARRKIKKVVHLSDRPATYGKTFRFYQRAERRMRMTLQENFEKRFEQALRTAR
ncbi:hypothetical protein FIU89_11185 [Roseovarius sp. THAF27]|uniref:hypothetical protein n=1 Tax=Roseovarius sp. THAF27 TaxID=2587850 RepID=UPI00126860F7|nr:hypothetical protein [Roseovarius sp. THAF27]QFT81173.1 hypothetical protein FIU89_11185 [Roseovarius sp. THAF27]